MVLQVVILFGFQVLHGVVVAFVSGTTIVVAFIELFQTATQDAKKGDRSLPPFL
jgi:predicted RND superfamily exporter protein